MITSTLNTFATEPNEVDVTIIFYKTKWLTQDTDTFSKGDIYFKISHSTTQTSGVATNDYEDSPSAHLDLSNSDFDGSGYYDKDYNNIRLNVGLLDWIIRMYDEDSGTDKLLFEARLTVKDASTTGERDYDDVNCHAEWYGETLLEYNFENSYLKFDWMDGEEKNGVYNGLRLWVYLDYHT
jgi:hypothetical protein